MTFAQQSSESRYNPNFDKNYPSSYRSWFLFVSVATLFAGIGSTGCSIVAKENYSDLSEHLFQVWVGIPTALLGLCGIILLRSNQKGMVTFYLVLAFGIVLTTATGAMAGGISYLNEGWGQTRQHLLKDNPKTCFDVSGVCTCTRITVPKGGKSCSDLEKIANLIISIIAMAAAGFICSVCAVYLSMMAICCGPWQHLDEFTYSKQLDPDRTKPNDVKTQSMKPVQPGNNGIENVAFSG